MSELQSKLDAIAVERRARNDLVSRRVEASLAESKARADDLAKTAGGVAQRLNERATRARTAAGWERAERPDSNDNLGLTFEDPEPAAEATNGHPAPEQPQRRGRHARSDDLEDDYSSTDWLA